VLLLHLPLRLRLQAPLRPLLRLRLEPRRLEPRLRRPPLLQQPHPVPQ
jgi:hypothetical protein